MNENEIIEELKNIKYNNTTKVNERIFYEQVLAVFLKLDAKNIPITPEIAEQLKTTLINIGYINEYKRKNLDESNRR